MVSFLRRNTSDRPGWLLLALFVAPSGGLAAAAACQLFLPLLLNPAADAPIPLCSHRDLVVALELTLFGFVLVYSVALLVAIVLGLPLHILLAVSGRQGWRTYALAGVLTGLVCWYAMDSFNSTLCGDTSNVCSKDLPWLSLRGRALAWGVIPGTGGALTFWALLRPDRPTIGAPESVAPRER